MPNVPINFNIPPINREPTYPNRWSVTNLDTGESHLEIHDRADEPTVEGTLFNDAFFKGMNVDMPIFYLGATGGTANAQTITNPNITAFKRGELYQIYFTYANTGALTLSLNEGTPIPITRDNNVVLTSGSIIANTIHLLAYDGTTLQLLSQSIKPAYKSIQRGFVEQGTLKNDFYTLRYNAVVPSKSVLILMGYSLSNTSSTIPAITPNYVSPIIVSAQEFESTSAYIISTLEMWPGSGSSTHSYFAYNFYWQLVEFY